MAPSPVDELSSSSKAKQHVSVTAIYTNSSTLPHSSRNFACPLSVQLPSTGEKSTEGKTAYLSNLHSSAKKLQEEINAFLTRKMEDDKLYNTGGDTPASKGRTWGKSREDVAEENYGEEEADGEEES